jgi:tetratricopeptide (TPR) repeat protein
MKDPYSTLGVSSNASDEEIKKAYRELVRKYHPDNYHNNPLADLAQEKMKEINEAYDFITKNRSGGGSGQSSYGQSGYGQSGYNRGSAGTSGGNPEFAQVRAAINNGNLDYAEQLLNASPNHNSEWHFLMGCLNYSKGWLDDARSYFQMAVNMDPSNREYAQAMARMENTAAYSPFGGVMRGGAMGGCTTCDICTALICADMCCNC